MNSYYLITPPGQSQDNFKQAILRGKQKGLPHEVIHWRWNLDKTKAIIQGEFSETDISWLDSKPFVQYLGDYVEGKAEKKVFDFIETKKVEWETIEV